MERSNEVSLINEAVNHLSVNEAKPSGVPSICCVPHKQAGQTELTNIKQQNSSSSGGLPPLSPETTEASALREAIDGAGSDISHPGESGEVDDPHWSSSSLCD